MTNEFELIQVLTFASNPTWLQPYTTQSEKKITLN